VPEFFEVVLHQRACRSFTDEDVPDEVVERLLDAAIHAPSAENLQPWVFVVVRDPAVRARIGELTRRAWDGGGRAYSEARLEPGLLADVDRGATGGIGAAPVLVVACGDTSLAHERGLPSSVFPAVQNLLLAATASGLGSALTTLVTAHADELAAELGLPDHIRPMAVVPVGHPARPLGPPRRRPVGEKAHRDRYGGGW
jgi:nitroreductase